LNFHFLPLIPVLSSSLKIFFLIRMFFSIESINQEDQDFKFNRSYTSGFTDCSCLLPVSSSIVRCNSGLLRLKFSSTIFQVSYTSGLLRINLPSTSFQLQLLAVIGTSQATIIFHQFSSSIVRLDYSGYNFLIGVFNFNVYFYFYLLI
jgi:hypothetical protein